MLELLNFILWVLLICFIIATVIEIWKVLDGFSDRKFMWLLLLIITIILSAAVFYSQVNISIIEARATVETFEEVKQKKQELGDTYILEPEILTKYKNALETIEKYKKLGLVKE